MHAVEIEGVTKTFGDHTAVNDLSLAVPQGAIYGFIGPNGSGKTTTLRMIMNILYPDRGTLQVLGEPVRGAASDRIGYLPEERGLYKKMKVIDILCFYAELKGKPNYRKKGMEWLDRLGLSDWANSKVDALSKGMSQKVQFISSIISEPDLVILDEPFSGLDPVNMDVLREEVLALRKRGSTVIFSTHDMGVAENLCDTIFMIFKGNKVLDGTLDSIQDTYGTDTVRVRMGEGDVIPEDLPGVDRRSDFGNLQELRLAENADTQAILKKLIDAGTVRHFEVTRPSLHDIFVRIAGPEAEEVNHA